MVSFSVYLGLAISFTYAFFQFLKVRGRFKEPAFTTMFMLIFSVFFDSLFWTLVRLHQTGIIPLGNPLSQLSIFISTTPALWIIPKWTLLLGAIFLIRDLREGTRRTYFEKWIRELSWS